MQTKEQTTAQDLANEYVNKVEDRYVLFLLSREQEAASSGCTCPSCQTLPQRLKNEIAREMNRLDPNGIFRVNEE